MVRRKALSREELAFPLTTVPFLALQGRSADNPRVIKQIIRGAIKGAFQKDTPSEPNQYSPDYGKKQKPLVSEDQIEFVCHLIESLQPADAIEAALASQFAITYIRGLNSSHNYIVKSMEMFEFGHQVLETLTKYRTKGAQLINVQYNHNQGQIVNIKNVKEDDSQKIIEVN